MAVESYGKCHDCQQEILVEWVDSYPMTPRPVIMQIGNTVIRVCKGCFNSNHRNRYKNLR